MGLKDSKFAFLPYEEAVKRVKSDELDRIKLAFKRASGSSNLMPKNSFIQDLIGDVVTKRLAEHLFMSCGGSNKGINFKDIVCCLVLITSGFTEEKVRFIFGMISVDGNHVTREDMENFFTVCENGPLPTSVKEHFAKVEKLSFAEFFNWVVKNEDCCDVTKWLLSEQKKNKGIKLSSTDDTPSFYQSLGKITKLCQSDLIELEKRYWSLKSCSVSGKFDIGTFSSQVSPPIPGKFCEGLFNAFDENCDGHVDFKELVLGIYACCRGTTSERLSFCFRVFDKDHDGVLSEDELVTMADGLIEIYQSLNERGPQTTTEELVNQILKDKTSRELTKTDFLPWASNNGFLHEFLLLLSQICHIIFGLRPSTKEEEGFVVRRWIEREERKGLELGNLYFLIATSWWNTWREYVNYKRRRTSNVISPRRSISSSSSNQSSWVDIDAKGPSISDVSEYSGHRPSVSSNGSMSKRSISQTTMVTSTQVQVEPSDAVNGRIPKVTALVYPGAIDNAGLVDPNDNKRLTNLTGEGGRLKPHVIRGRDFEVIPEPVWRALFTWYGGNIALPRQVIITNDVESPLAVELYPVQLHLYRHAPPPRHITLSFHSLGIAHFPFQSQSQNAPQPALPVPPKRTLMYYGSFSRKNNLRQVQEFICNRLKIRTDDLRLWDFSENQPFLLEEETRLLEECGIRNGHHILIEVRNRDMSWPEEMNSLVATKNFRERSNTGPLVKGATGLHNLGNTCFMNSAVQCISNTYPLTLYFLGKLHLFELNKVNPLGLKGILAKRYGDIVYDLWNGMYRSIAPVRLRWTIGKYAPRFNGFQQHDAQELLSFLLDGLHEDLNRVHDKPYIELKDSNGRPDKEVAQEAWENHRKRNQSIVVDLFQGQLKSQVRCLSCGNCSVRFDPYTFLSLPIPMENSLHLEIVVFTMDGAAPVRYGLLLCNDATVKTLKAELEKLSGIPVTQLVIAETFGALVSAFLVDTKKLRENVTGILYAYEVRPQTSLQFATRHQLTARASAPAALASSASSSPNRLSEPAVLGGSNSNSNNLLGIKGNRSPRRSPKSPRKSRLAPFRKLEKRTNGVVPTQNDDSKIADGIGGAGITSASSNAELSTECFCESNDPTKNRVVVVMHRKMVQMDAYFLSWQKFRPSLFGIPLLISCSASTKRKEIHEDIWRYVHRFVSMPASSRSDSPASQTYPFDLKIVQKDGQFCAVCPWFKFCRGCKLICDDEEFGNVHGNIAIDWDPMTLHLNYQQGQERLFVDHPSLEESMRLLREPINIDQCLKDFTKEEELGDDETWYCPECKNHQKIAKKFSLWSLPPILIIHLKRFQLLNNRWIKSNKIVKFSMQNFDPSQYLVERDRRKRNPSERKTGKILTVKSSIENVNQLASEVSTSSGRKTSDRSYSCPNQDIVVDLDDLEHSLEECDEDVLGDGYSYRLYAISCHSGMLSGGHYVSYARNPNGKWYKYNDSSCKEVDPSVIEKESPYLLFFERDGINVSDYLPDVKNANLDISSDDDEFETDVKKYCVIQ